MSFNDRLNMLTWDPETTPLPTSFKHDELYIFDEYAAQPTNAVSQQLQPNAAEPCDGWIRRAVKKYQKTKARRREEKRQRNSAREDLIRERAPVTRSPTTKKRSLQMTLWGKRMDTCTGKPSKDQPYQLPLLSGNSAILDEDDETKRFLFDQEEHLSDTESDDSTSDVDTLCHSSAFEGALSDLDDDGSDSSDSDSDSDWSEWTRSSSTSSCYFSAAEDDHNHASNDDHNLDRFFSPRHTFCSASSSSFCECGDCPAYMAIEREVTNSNCWMNETERRALCRVLQAYSTYNPKTRFHKRMIASAEECLLVFQGDELAAFNAFVMLAQTTTV